MCANYGTSSTFSMKLIAVVAFAVTVLYGVIGNVVIYIILLHRRAPVRFSLSAMPLYLYGVCNRSVPPVRRALKFFALSTNIALILAIPSWIILAATTI
jgi:hypothetical protein